MRKFDFFVTVALLLVFSVVGVANADTITGGSDIPVTMEIQTLCYFSGDKTERVTFRLSNDFFSAVQNGGYSRSEIQTALLKVAGEEVGYSVCEFKENVLFEFERTDNYVDEPRDNSANSYVWNGFYADVFDQELDISAHYERRLANLTQSLAESFSGVTVDLTGSEIYYVYAAEYDIESNATRTFEKDGLKYHYFRLKNGSKLKLHKITPNNLGWYVTIISAGVVATAVGITVILRKRLCNAKEKALNGGNDG